MLTGLLFGQDILNLKSGESFEGTFHEKLGRDILFKAVGDTTMKKFPIWNVETIVTKNGELTYPFDIPTKELSKQDVLLHKSGKNYKGTFIGKVDENIIFKIEGEKSNSAFSINDVDIVITSRGGIKVELYYPFDIETKIEEDKSEYRKRFEAFVTGNMDEYLKQNPRNTPPWLYAISCGMLLWLLIYMSSNPDWIPSG